MAYNVKATLQRIQGYMKASGYVKAALIGEPKAPPDTVTSAVFMSSTGVAILTLGTTIEQHVVINRLYHEAFSNAETAELVLAEIVSEVWSDLLGEFDLGATIRNVDAGGQHGVPASTRWGYVDVGGTMFRVADMLLPLIVDDSATLTA